MLDMEREKALLAKYPFHIYLMVKAAKQALDEGRARIEDGMLVFQEPAAVARPTEKVQELP
jgi:hypothetical protein